jgi:hypothetical protein
MPFRPRTLRGALALGLMALNLAAPAAARTPSPELLGVRLGMMEKDARRILEQQGKPVSESEIEELKQSWLLRDPRYDRLTIRYDAKRRVQWVTAFAREHGRRVRYEDVGDVEDAHRSGTYVYTWTLAGIGKTKPTALTARGLSAEHLASLSIHAPTPAAGPPPEEVQRDSLR